MYPDSSLRNILCCNLVAALLWCAAGVFASAAALGQPQSANASAPQGHPAAPASKSDTLSSARIQDHKASPTLSSAPLPLMERAWMDSLGRADLPSVVGRFAGVSIKDYGGLGGIKTVDVRNMGASHTAVEYDGVDMGNLQNAQVDIGRFELSSLERVSVEMAGSDNIFQSANRQLASCLLSLESARPRFTAVSGSNDSLVYRPFNLLGELSGGSFFTFSSRLQYEQDLGRDWAIRLGGSYHTTRGDYPFLVQNGVASEWLRRLGSEVSGGRAQADVYGTLGKDGGQLQGKILYSDDSRGIPGAVIYYVQDPTERLWNRDVTALLRWENQYGARWRVRASAAYNWSYTCYRNESALLREPETDHYDHHKLSLGAIAACRLHRDWQVSLAEDLTLAKLDSDIPESRFPRRLHSATALSAKWEHGRWLVRGTVGLIYVTDQLEEKAAGAQSLPKLSDRFHCSPSLSASCAIIDGLRIRLSYKDSYRIPSFNDLYYARVGNPSLRPERAQQFNLGLTWRLTDGSGPRGLSVEMTADGYCNLIKDKIVAIPKMFIWSMRNVGEAVAAGADLATRVSYAFTPDVAMALMAKYSYQHAVDVTDRQSQTWQQQLPYTPRHTGSATLSLLTRWINLSYTLDGVSARYSIGVPLREYCLYPYLLHGVSASHTFSFKGWKLYLSVQAENLGNTQYEIVKSYPMPGFQCRGIIRFTL